jgi:hypothetical protein
MLFHTLNIIFDTKKYGFFLLSSQCQNKICSRGKELVLGVGNAAKPSGLPLLSTANPFALPLLSTANPFGLPLLSTAIGHKTCPTPV